LSRDGSAAVPAQLRNGGTRTTAGASHTAPCPFPEHVVAGLWAEDGIELVESAQIRGHEELDARIAEAYKEFVESGKFAVTSANDAFGHHDAVTFTIQLTTKDGARSPGPPASFSSWARTSSSGMTTGSL
jgi:hypothetical protein